MDYIHRQLKNKLLSTLAVNPVVYLNGPRQAGKSTLVRHIAKKDFPADYVTFDNITQMAAAAHNPETYLNARQQALIVDEVQLVPDIFRALKSSVDELRQQLGSKIKGQFLLTGSANIMALPKLSNSLVGRMGVLTLYPLSVSEIVHGKGDFIARLFKKAFQSDMGQHRLQDLLHRATFPEITGATEKEKSIWFDGYITTILQRDVRALAEIEKLSVLPHLLRILANRAGGLTNDAEIARDAGLNAMTCRNYKTLLNMLFITFELAPWYRNIGKRLVKSTKGYVSDNLLLCHLLQYNLSDLEKNRPELFGHVIENFVATELMKLIACQDQNLSLLHFRTGDNKKVDFVIEKPNGELAGIEVKNRDTVRAEDLKGLKSLQELAKQDFICGIVLYRGKEVVPFGQNLWAVPIANLWG